MPCATFADRMNRRRYRHPLWFRITVGGSMLLIAPWLLGPGVGDAPNWTPR